MKIFLKKDVIDKNVWLACNIRKLDEIFDEKITIEKYMLQCKCSTQKFVTIKIFLKETN